MRREKRSEAGIGATAGGVRVWRTAPSLPNAVLGRGFRMSRSQPKISLQWPRVGSYLCAALTIFGVDFSLQYHSSHNVGQAWAEA